MHGETPKADRMLTQKVVVPKMAQNHSVDQDNSGDFP